MLKNVKKFLALLLAVMMILSLNGFAVLAESAGEADERTESVVGEEVGEDEAEKKETQSDSSASETEGTDQQEKTESNVSSVPESVPSAPESGTASAESTEDEDITSNAASVPETLESVPESVPAVSESTPESVPAAPESTPESVPAAPEPQAESVQSVAEVTNWTVRFDLEKGAYITINGRELDSKTAISENGSLVFKALPREGYVVEKVFLDDGTEVRHTVGSDGKASEDEYILEGLTSDLTVHVKTKEKPEEIKYQTASNKAVYGPGFTVLLSYGEDAKIPEDTKVKVREYKEGSGVYEEYFEGAVDATGADASRCEAKVIEVSFVDKNGSELEPQGPVSVQILFRKPVEVADAAEVDLVHFKENGGVENVAVDTSASPTQAGAAVSAVSFESDSFSFYVMLYTVDFTYGGYQFSMPGDGEILLSEVFTQLGIPESAADAANAEFTNRELLKIEQLEDNWKLTSLKPFSTEETLTITMANESKYVIGVTDAQTSSSNLGDFLVEASINAPVNQGVYQISTDETYDVTLTFSEEGNPKQFANHGTLTYTLPAGLTISGQNGKFDVVITRTDGTYTIRDNTFSVNEGVLSVNWNDQDPNYHHMTASNNVEFSVAFSAKIEEGTRQLTFSDEIIKEVHIDDSNSVEAGKSASVDKQNGKLKYTVTIKSTGKSTNVVLEDTLTGQGLSLDAGSFAFSSNTGQVVQNSVTVNGNHFTVTIPSMKNNETITLFYDANIDTSVLQMVDNKIVIQAGNSAKVQSEDDHDNKPVEYNTVIDYTPTVSKSNATDAGVSGTKVYKDWKINVNSDHVSAAGFRITDTIDASSQGIMKYSGDGITVKVSDAYGEYVRIDPVPWDQLENKNDTTWTYVIPADDAGKAYKYEITYRTEVETANLTTKTTVKNTVTPEGGTPVSGTGEVIPVNGEVTIKKEVTEIDKPNKKISWKVTFTVPKNGLSKAVVTDTYPNRYVIDKVIIEKIITGTLSVEGLTDGESYDTQFNDTDVVITFKNGANNGLKGTGQIRTIVVTLSTELNSEWLAASAENTYLKDHTNTVKIDVGEEVSTSAIAEVIAGSINKTAQAAGTRPVDGIELPIYRYEVSLEGVESDSFVINDYFDTEILELYTGTDKDDNLYMFGGGAYYQATKGSERVSYSSTAAGNRSGVQFSISAASLPKDNGSYYTGYKLVYYLTVRNAAALSTLGARAAAGGGSYSIGNTAEWEGITSTGSIKYGYQALKKEILTPDAELSKSDEDIFVDYKITLNPAAHMLNNGKPLTMTDTVTNMSVVLTSITADPSEGVSWDMSGNTVTYTIPDSTAVVITYRTRVIFEDIGKVGETKSVQISNKAAFNGEASDITKTVSRHNSGKGSGTVYSISLMKYRAGNMTNRLKGAKFELLDAAKNPVLDKNQNPVTYETDENGMFTVEGDQDRDGWALSANTRYYLRETDAPEGYMLANFDYSFQISKDGTTDYAQYIYHSGDTLTAKNYPGCDLKVIKDWANGYAPSDDEYVVVKLQQKIGENGEWSDTIRRQQDNVWVDDVGPTTLTLNNANKWKGTFSGLPLTVPETIGSEYDVSVSYQIREISINGIDADTSVAGDARNGQTGNYRWSYGLSGNTFTVTNTVETTTVSATKAWKNADGTTTAPSQASVVFSLYSGTTEAAAAASTAAVKTVTLDGTVDDNGEATAWTATFSGLPKYASDGSTELKYIVKETTGLAGYIVKYGESDDAVYVKSGETITNTEEGKGSATLTKKGANNAALTGAKFDLYMVKTEEESADTKVNTDSLVTGTDGKITVDNLTPGRSYYFVETEAPEGYVTPTGDAAKTAPQTVEKGKVTPAALSFEMSNTEEGKGSAMLTKKGANNAALAGAKFDLYMVMAGEETADTKVNTASLVTGTDGKITVDNLTPGRSYYFVETEAPEGYVTPSGDAAKTAPQAVEKGKVTPAALSFEMSNTITSIKVSKVDVTDDKELEGAHIQILDKTGKVVEEWDSTKEAHEVEGLKTGVTYTLSETVAPEGYALTTNTTFKLNADGTLDTAATTTTVNKEGVLLVEDARIYASVKKLRSNNGTKTDKFVEGATLSIHVGSADGALAKDLLTGEDASWTTADAVKTVSLAAGKYVLVEDAAPSKLAKYWSIAEPISFEVTTSGKVTDANGSALADNTVTMYDEFNLSLYDEDEENAKRSGTKLSDTPKPKRNTTPTPTATVTPTATPTTTRTVTRTPDVRTGDEQNAAIPFALGVLALAAIGWILIQEKKRRRS